MQLLNRLSSEKSPYLLQHKDNPVWWWPWCDDAFRQAKLENKPIFLSIGYSTCYWCHVMERDSFEDHDVAAALNKNFVCIKVDREERPDLDALYMESVVAMSGHGGWPMSVFLNHDKKPFYGATFFYKAHFLTILERLFAAWSSDREKVEQSAESVSNFLIERADIPPVNVMGVLPEALLELAEDSLAAQFDQEWGGFGKAPKFPPTGQIGVLLRRSIAPTTSSRALSMARVTLDAMARGGLFDQVGGGFSRYSTDAQWLVPHFEKMLYDNALLTTNYLEAFQITGEQAYAEVARESLTFVLNEMTDPDGGFYSAFDAGNVGEEGEFYVWSERELREVLSDEELKRITEVYEITADGNFEAKTNVLHISKNYPLSVRSDSRIVTALKKLAHRRLSRAKLRRDDKVLTSWNGLMIAACALGGLVLKEGSFIDAAVRAAQFLKHSMWKEGQLLRRYFECSAGIEAGLEEYVYLIDGLISLYQATWDIEWLVWAEELQQKQDTLFWDNEKGGYFASIAEDLLVKRKEFIDGALPSPHGVAVLNLLRLEIYFNSESFGVKAETLIKLIAPLAERHAPSFSRLITALDFQNNTPQQLVISCYESSSASTLEQIRFKLAESFTPRLLTGFCSGRAGEERVALLADKNTGDEKPLFYLCVNRSCAAPTRNFDEILKKLKGEKGLLL